MHESWDFCGGPRTASCSWFSSSTLWSLEIELKLPGCIHTPSPLSGPWSLLSQNQVITCILCQCLEKFESVKKIFTYLKVLLRGGHAYMYMHTHIYKHVYMFFCIQNVLTSPYIQVNIYTMCVYNILDI